MGINWLFAFLLSPFLFFISKGLKAHQDPRVTGGVAYVGKDIADIQSAVKNMQFQMAAQVNLIFLIYASRNWQKY